MQLNTILLMAEWQVKGLQLFMSLSLLIVLHEFGHFFFAKLFKTRVEKFYLFFDFLFPFGNVLPFSLFKKKVGDTTYGIGWFPLGGYVKIAGMVDESMDKEQLALPPQPWEYRSKKTWQRLLIMLGGIIVNIIVAIIIYIGVFKYWGESYLAVKDMKYGITVDSVGYKMGLRNGDKLVSVDGKPVEQTKDLVKGILYYRAKTFTVNRDGANVELPVVEGTIRNIVKAKSAFMGPRVTLGIDSVMPNSVSSAMGLKAGDSIIMVNNQAVSFKDQIDDQKKQLAGNPLELTVIRNQKDTVKLTGVLPKDSSFGFFVTAPMDLYRYTDVDYTFGAAVSKGLSYTKEQFVDYWYQLRLLFTSKEVKASESVGGIGSFASHFPGTFDWQAFWVFTAFISIILAFMNLLPIPGLDGGYVIFLLWEMITGRKVNEKVMEVATTIGLVLLLAVMLWANGMDIFKAFKN